VADSNRKIPTCPAVAPYIATKTVSFGKIFADEFLSPFSVINSSDLYISF